MMKTGFGESSGAYEYRQAEALVNIITPVLEKSLLLACKYCKACGRDVVLAQDVEYAAKYCAMHKVGEDIGSVLELDDDDDDDDDGVEEVEEGEGDFTRYEGADPLMQAINEAYDQWNAWEPTIPVEIMLKNAIDGGGGGLGL
jgi:hypothetical protein